MEIFDLELGDEKQFIHLSFICQQHLDTSLRTQWQKVNNKVDLLKLLEYLSFYNTHKYLKYFNFMLHN